jgi:hypothetical protein
MAVASMGFLCTMPCCQNHQGQASCPMVTKASPRDSITAEANLWRSTLTVVGMVPERASTIVRTLSQRLTQVVSQIVSTPDRRPPANRAPPSSYFTLDA